MSALAWADVPDGIEVHRLANTWRGARPVYSIRERGDWWRDSRGRRRWWSYVGSVRASLAAEVCACDDCGIAVHRDLRCVVFDQAEAERLVCVECQASGYGSDGFPAVEAPAVELAPVTPADLVAGATPTRAELRAWIRSAPEGATMGDGARHFGVTVDRWMAIRDGQGEP